MLATPIVVPNQGTADRLQLIEQRYKLDQATGRQSAFVQFCLASATQTFWGPGTVTAAIAVADLAGFLTAHSTYAADFAADSAATLTMAGDLAKTLGLKLADGTALPLAS